MELSKRLQAVADLVTPGMYVADVGTDHGFIPIYLVANQKVSGAVAMDINQGPLERAREHIRENHLEAYIGTRLSDGLAALAAGEAESVIIAGMGGGLIIKILTDHKIPEGIKELILQPQSEIPKVRNFLKKNKYHIIKEDMVLDEGKFYTILKAIKDVPAAEHLGNVDMEENVYGRYLPEHRHPILEQFLHREIGLKEEIIQTLYQRRGTHIEQRIKELKDEVAYAKQILYRYY